MINYITLEQIQAVSGVELEVESIQTGSLFKQLTEMHSAIIESNGLENRLDGILLNLKNRLPSQDKPSQIIEMTSIGVQVELDQNEEDSEDEQLLKEKLLEQQNKQIKQYLKQIDDLHNEMQMNNNHNNNIIIQQNGIFGTHSSNENSIIDGLNRQLLYTTDAQQILSQQMMESDNEVVILKEQLQQYQEEMNRLRNEEQENIYIVKQLRDRLLELEVNKQAELDIIGEDYQDKINKKNMIIDELEQQNRKYIQQLKDLGQDCYGPSPQLLGSSQFLGSDSGMSNGSKRSRQEKDQIMRNIKRLTSMTAGMMSSKQDYSTLGMLGKLDAGKSQIKMEQIVNNNQNEQYQYNQK